jgi:hypothetical protein
MNKAIKPDGTPEAIKYIPFTFPATKEFNDGIE